MNMGFWKALMAPLHDQTPILAWNIQDDGQGNSDRKVFFMGSWISESRRAPRIENTKSTKIKNVTPVVEEIEYGN